MAYTINNGAIFALEYVGSLFGQQVMNTFHYRWEGPVIANGLTFGQTFIGTLAQQRAMQTLWQDMIAGDVIGCRVYGQWIHPIRYRKINAAMPTDGGHESACFTANTASVLSLFADQANRHGIGNKHIPGLPNEFMDAGDITNGMIAHLDTFGIAAVAAMPTAGGAMVPVIYNRGNPDASFDVTGYRVNLRVRTMRRRTVGLGI